jgi:hypothetical protein
MGTGQPPPRRWAAQAVITKRLDTLAAERLDQPGGQARQAVAEEIGRLR